MHIFYAMNTEFQTSGLDYSTQLRAEAWFSFVEKHLSRFHPMSELSRLNQKAGRPFFASPLLFKSIYIANQYYQQTEGLFNPFLGSLLADLGYRHKMDWTADSLPLSSQMITNAYNKQVFQHLLITIDLLVRSIRIPSYVQCDLGGIAKGWSAEQFSILLQKEGIRSGMINAGGDIVIWNPDKYEYILDIEDPYNSDQQLTSISIHDSVGIATSSIIKRKWTNEEGKMLHHIIDPRTLEPSLSDLVQVTVIASSLTDAEVYAKCVLILGSEVGSLWLKQQSAEAKMIAVCKDQSVITV